MRYNPDIIDQIEKELEKVPNVRVVCAKMNIHHSTFYRWQGAYERFRRRISLALALGRANTSDKAEAVVIRKVNEEDLNASKFWLTHNDARYMSRDNATYHAGVIEREMIKILHTDINSEKDTFESLFKLADEYVEKYEIEDLQEWIKPILTLLLRDDQLTELFHASYEKHKMDDREYKENEWRFKPKDKDDDPELPTPSSDLL